MPQLRKALGVGCYFKQIVYTMTTNENTLRRNGIESNSKPPYLLGLLGIIPLVGFFVGAGLTLYGLIKYKDKKLVIIGIACMLFTVFVYSTLYYVGFVSDSGKKEWEKLSQMELNGLIKNIEYYKIENGKYPDSLKELLKKNEFVSIVDVTQPIKNKERGYYNYKKKGENYLLFSSGTDGIPNTKDDIFPQIKNLKNVGWIKN
ncbi:hypothetical protein [Flavobacterium sp. 3HN19-14]|uniref:hypothetical protein n=1 Tax=Flavobacterium sp. 3HN19-14 TaxID=3448133 RepID=UPI003EE25147